MSTQLHERIIGAAYDLTRYGAAVVLAGAGALILLGQVINWLRLGAWPAIPLTRALCHFAEEIPTWCDAPRAWLGLHAIVDWLPLSLSLFFAALMLVLLPKFDPV